MKETFDEEFSRLFEKNLKEKFKQEFERSITYNKNKINKTVINDIIISTMFAEDINKYETGIKNKNQDWDIIEYYNTKEEAELGHNKYVEKYKIE